MSRNLSRERSALAAQLRLAAAQPTEAAVRKRIAAGVDMLHLATHGVLRRDVPTASGALLAARSPTTSTMAASAGLRGWPGSPVDLTDPQS